jgi:hypothetical protein
MEMTRYDRLSRADQFRGLPAPSLEKPVPEEGRFISLPQPAEISNPPLELRSAIESRRSIREYARDALTLEELAPSLVYAGDRTAARTICHFS